MIRHLGSLALLAGSAALLWATFLQDDSQPEQPTPLAERNPASIQWYSPRQWDNVTNTTSKLSVFIFRDRNRDGVLDPGDLPMTGVAVSVARPDGTYRTRRSNINGYTNFTLRMDGETEDIRRADTPYHWTVQLPEGWQVTTDNTVQTATFRRLTGAPGDMVTDTPPAVVGLAPTLGVGGIFPNMPDTTLMAQHESGRVLTVTTDAEGRFDFLGDPGSWQLLEVGSRTPLREFRVKDAPVILASGTRPTSASRTEPQVVDFEVLNRSVIEKLPVGYHGLGWDYLLAIDNQYYQGPGYVNVLAGGRAVGYGSSGYPVTVTGLNTGDSFDFDGGYFAVAWSQAEGETLELEGWRNGKQVYTDALRLSHLGPTWFQADYRDIERLILRTRRYWQFTTDDWVVRVPSKP